MAVLTDQQRKFYEATLQVTKQEISDLQNQIEEERVTFSDRIAELQNAINASKQMYAAACSRSASPMTCATKMLARRSFVLESVHCKPRL